MSRRELVMVDGLLRHGRSTTAFVKWEAAVVRLHGRHFRRTTRLSAHNLPVYEPIEENHMSTTHTPTETHRERLERIAASISLGMNCEIRIGWDADRSADAFFVQIRCWRMDVITKEMGWGYGGKAWPSVHATDSEIIQMIFGLYKGYWEHEARETFALRNEAGEYRRPFGPHIDTWALWSVARRVDVRSARHVEDQDPRQRAEYLAASKADAAMGDHRG